MGGGQFPTIHQMMSTVSRAGAFQERGKSFPSVAVAGAVDRTFAQNVLIIFLFFCLLLGTLLFLRFFFSPSFSTLLKFTFVVDSILHTCSDARSAYRQSLGDQV